MFFKKMKGVHGFIGVKSNSKTLLLNTQNFEPFLENRALKFQKSANMT